MPLQVAQRDVESIIIVDLEGRLVVGPDLADIRRTFEQLAAQNSNRLILNLRDVDYIDSTGLGMLVIGHSMAKDSGGAMKLLHLSKRCAELLVLTKLATVFEIFDDEQSAINSFFPDREIRRFDVLEFVKGQSGDPPKS